ncbi:hypothetical protein BVI1335_1100022 [Burkholderia vietnamiensis]|nr:hypothetical protein BVI1335_1100022 [Burkholderia vietnamiensis]
MRRGAQAMSLRRCRGLQSRRRSGRVRADRHDRAVAASEPKRLKRGAQESDRFAGRWDSVCNGRQ